MHKRLFNLMVQIEKKQGIFFSMIMFFNEWYMKFYLFFSKPKLALRDYRSSFFPTGSGFTIKALSVSDLDTLNDFFMSSIDADSPEFIMPHKTDLKTMRSLFKKVSHIPLGIFYKDALIGYALIRLLFPKTGSYAIFISGEWQGKGIGTAALEKELDLIRELGFKPNSAVNKRNLKSLRMLQKLKIRFSNDLGEYFEVRDTD